jgi:hypothetical protein
MSMNKLIFFRSFIVIGLFCWSSLHAQSYPFIPNIIPPSPNAATLAKFADIPVSPYTGTADITVPIYEIHTKGLDVPITLDYHTGGIRMKDESGWVGLGWALTAGGAISRTILDRDDFNTAAPYFTSSVPQLEGDMSSVQYPESTLEPYFSQYFFDMYCTYKVNVTGGTEDYWAAFTSGGGPYDIEPDIFTYNFPGHSGKFIILRNRQVVLQSQDNIVIKVDNAGNTFTVIDEKGNNFIFQDRDSSGSSTGIGSTFATNSWNLSKIKTQLNDSVTFTYTSDNTWTYIAPEIYEQYNVECSTNQGYYRGNPAGTYYLNKTLQTINFSGGQLQFAFDGKRSDLAGGKKLDAIKIYSKAGSSLTYMKEHDFFYTYFDPIGDDIPADSLELKRLRLDSVKEVSGTNSMPPYSFVYFPQANSGTYIQNFMKHGYSVDHWGFYNGVSNSTYIPNVTYEYDPPGLLTGLTYYTYTNGAVRDPDPTAISTELFALQQVNYPTGGKTVLTYSQNDYDNTKSSAAGSTDFPVYTLMTILTQIPISATGTTTGTLNLSGIFPQLYTGSPNTNLTLDVAFMGTGNNATDYHKLPPGKIYFTFSVPGEFTFKQDITGSNLNCGTTDYVCSNSFPLTITGAPSNCTWTGYIDPSVSPVYFSDIVVTFSYQEFLTTYNNNPSLSASGLRVNTITDYSSPTTIAKQRTYNYGYQAINPTTGTLQNYSNGILMSYPSYGRYSSLLYNDGNQITGTCTYLTLYGSSYTQLTSVIKGNIVGYSQVAESTVDPNSGHDIGKTVYTYYNSPDTPISYGGFRLPGTLNIGNSLDGTLLSKTVYSDYEGVYNPVSATVNTYHTANRSIYYSPKYWFPGSTPAWGAASCAADTGVSQETYACFYPSIKSEKILQDASYEYAYDQSNPASYTLTTKNYHYDNPIHYLVTRSTTTDSKGNTLVSRLKYPQDYIPTGNNVTGNIILDTMIGRNIVAGAIEKQDSLYYQGSSTGYITGAQLNLFRIGPSYHTIVPDRIYKLGIQSPITNFQPFAISGNTTSLDSRYRQAISYDQYDANNNLSQYTSIDQNPGIFIWDYMHVYPIAKVKNAVLADVAATSFEADGTGGWTFTGTATADPTTITGNLCYNLGQTGGAITKSALTSTTAYVLSYWIKGTTALSISGTISGYPIQGKTINGWTYFEHEITGLTTATVSGSGSIDELRLYPATAQMTTYTYAPLAGMTTICDVDNKVTYYFYDEYQRLLRIKDQDGNIIKTFQYHYQGQ